MPADGWFEWQRTGHGKQPYFLALEDASPLSFENREAERWSRYFEKRSPFGMSLSPNRKIFEARKRETAALGAGEKLVLGHPLAATIGDSARCMQNLEKVLFTGPKTSDTVTFICD